MATRDELLTAFQNADAAGDTETAKAIAQQLGNQPEVAAADANPVAAPAVGTSPAPSTASVTEDQLRADPDWIAASKTLYAMNKGDTDKPDDTAAANYGLDQMGWFNNNIVQMGLKAASIKSATPAQQQAFLYLTERSKDLAWSGEGVARVAAGVLTDPSTYVGLSSLGFGTVGEIAAATTGKAGLEAVLKAGVNTGARAAIDTGVVAASRDAIAQSVPITAGAQEKLDYGQIARSGAAGAAAGFLLGGALGAGSHIVSHLGDDAAAAATKAADDAIWHEPDTAPLDEAKPEDTPSEAPVGEQPVNPEQPPVAANDQPAPQATEPTAPEAPPVNPETPVAPDAPPDTLTPEEAPAPTDPVAANDQPANSNIPGLMGPGKGFEGHLNAITDAVKNLAHDGPIRVVDDVQSMSALSAATKGISDLIAGGARAGDGGSLMAALRQTGMTDYQIQALAHATQQANDTLHREISRLTRIAMETKDRPTGLALRKKVDLLEATRGPVQNLDTELSTQTARDLRMRQEGLNVGELRGLSITSLMEKGGLSRSDAEAAFMYATNQRETLLQNRTELAALEQKIAIASQGQDFTKLQVLLQQKETLLGRSDGQLAADGSQMGALYRTFNTAAKAVVELMISNVMSISTIVKVTIPSYVKVMTKPFANYVAKGVMNEAGMHEMIGSYVALVSASQGAFRMASLAFKYEKAILMRNTERGFFGSGVIPKKIGGGIVRFFPRLVTGADTFMEALAYRSYGIGKATGNAWTEATEQGLTGAGRDAYVKKVVSDTTDRLYSKDPSTDTHVIDMLMREGQDRGYGGAQLDTWVRNELNTNSAYLRSATDEAGKNYAKDMLFKREFSGNNPASKLALEYETFVKRNPIMKIVGQLFFRTPIRIFQEGVRITPMLNLVTPGFLTDLAGKNGEQALIRSRGEAMMSLGVMGSVMSLYANGAITGGGPTDYLQNKQAQEAGFKPYSIKLPDGTYWSYRSIEPLATPLKMIVNALDAVQMLQYRVAQGETNLDDPINAATQYAQLGVAAIAQAFHDASLLQGVSNVFDFAAQLDNPKAGLPGDQLVKVVGGFLASSIPSTWTKSRQLMGQTDLDNPITIEQMLRAKINPNDPLVPKQYSATGRVRTQTNPMGNMFVLAPSTHADWGKDLSPTEQAVEKDLWLTARAANTEFVSPIKSPMLPDIPDLRKVKTGDGTESLYDRWQTILTTEKIGGRGIVDALNEVTTGNAPYGSPAFHPELSASQAVNGAVRGSDSARAAAYNAILTAYRNQAAQTLKTSEGWDNSDLQTAATRHAQQMMSNNVNGPVNP